MSSVGNILNSEGISHETHDSYFLISCLHSEHDDKHPSMIVNSISGDFKCWSCGYSGNLYKYFKLESNPSDVLTNRLKKKIEKLLNANTITIPEDAEPVLVDYRGISTGTYKKFSAFYSRSFKDRISIPIYDVSNNIVGIIGRLLGDGEKVKYMQYPNKQRMPLYPFNHDKGEITLVEGIFDVLNLYDKGFKYASCYFGCSTSGAKAELERFSILRMLGVTTINICFDGDTAGRKGAKALKSILETDNYIVNIIDLPNGKDPGSLSREEVKILFDMD